MIASVATGWVLIGSPVAFNAAFAALAVTFGYPDILRRPTDEVLARFRAGGPSLILLWWGFAMTAVVLAPVAVMLSAVIVGADPILLMVAATVGVLAAVVQFLGLVRWPFLVPYLARASAAPDLSPARRDAIDIVFQSFNRFLGVAIGEHLGFLLTGTWTILVGAAITQSSHLPTWLGVAGIVVGAVLVLCSLEFVGPFESSGWKLAAALTPFTYIVWSLWLVATGVLLLL
nr:hypothetical protein GCM10025699_13750 [Microbacterium flavescens]